MKDETDVETLKLIFYCILFDFITIYMVKVKKQIYKKGNS